MGVEDRDVGFVVAEFARTKFASAGLFGSCGGGGGGGGGALPSPIDPTILPRKLMAAKAGCKKEGTTVAADGDQWMEKS